MECYIIIFVSFSTQYYLNSLHMNYTFLILRFDNRSADCRSMVSLTKSAYTQFIAIVEVHALFLFSAIDLDFEWQLLPSPYILHSIVLIFFKLILVVLSTFHGVTFIMTRNSLKTWKWMPGLPHMLLTVASMPSASPSFFGQIILPFNVRSS